MLLTINDPAVRRTVARQRWCYRALKRAGKHITQRPKGFSLRETDVRKTWRKAS